MAQAPDANVKADDEVMAMLKDNAGFVNKKGDKVSFDDATKGMELIGLYFSAHWCGPCRRFTPKLGEYYTQWKKDNKKIVIIFGSSDKDDKSFKEYFDEMADWLALPFGDDRIGKLKKKYNVNGIPWLVMLDKNGKLIENEADTTVGSHKEKAYDQWIA